MTSQFLGNYDIMVCLREFRLPPTVELKTTSGCLVIITDDSRTRGWYLGISCPAAAA